MNHGMRKRNISKECMNQCFQAQNFLFFFIFSNEFQKFPYEVTFPKKYFQMSEIKILHFLKCSETEFKNVQFGSEKIAL